VQPNLCPAVGLAAEGLPLARTRRKKSTPPVVLIVEDEPDLRVLAESNIADFGYTTLSAGNGNEAMVLLEEDKRIVLLFTDINMPDGHDGLELARCAIELRPGLRVLYTSGAAPTDGMTALFVEGATFLQKPYTRAELMQAVQGDGEAAEKHSG
jgi:CheY-like chemotaxis protein